MRDAPIDGGVALFHVALGVGEWGETELGVEAVGVFGDELETAEVLQTWVRDQELHRGFREAAAAIRFEDIDVAQIGKGRVVGDDADESDLTAIGRVEADAEGVLQRASDGFARDAGGPIAGGEKRVNGVDVEERRVVGDQITVVVKLVRHGRSQEATS